MKYYLITSSHDVLDKNPITIGVEATSEQAALKQYAVLYLECIEDSDAYIESKVRDILTSDAYSHDQRVTKLCELISKEDDKDISTDDEVFIDRSYPGGH